MFARMSRAVDVSLTFPAQRQLCFVPAITRPACVGFRSFLFASNKGVLKDDDLVKTSIGRVFSFVNGAASNLWHLMLTSE